METWLQILRSLTLPEKRSLMLTCKIMHDTVSPIVYRILVTQERIKPRPVKAMRSSSHIPRVPITPMLPCLLRSTRTDDGRAVSRRYVEYIKSFTVLSYIPLSNLRSIPILVHILRHMTSLQFLRIEICEESIPLLIALLFRFNLVRLPTLVHTMDASTASSPHTVLHLPALRGFRTKHCELAGVILHLRPLEVLILDGDVLPGGFSQFIHSTSAAASSLTTLSMTLGGPIDFVQSAVQTVILSLPALEYLSFRSDPAFTLKAITVSYSVRNQIQI